jgi:hypothetical protein
LPATTKSLAINGPGRDSLSVDGVGNFRIVFANSSNVGFLHIRDVTLLQGVEDYGGCIYAAVSSSIVLENVAMKSCTASSGNGGGLEGYLLANGQIILRQVIFDSNKAMFAGGGASLGASEVIIEDSLFLENFVTDSDGSGGALIVGGSSAVTVQRSTFWANESPVLGSAIAMVSAAATLRLEHSTVSKNEITGTTGSNEGGAVASWGTLTLFNTVVAGNLEQVIGSDVADVTAIGSGSVISDGFNFIGSNEGSAATFPAGYRPTATRQALLEFR